MRIRYAGRMWDVRLEDDGTLDTIVSVSPDVIPADNAPNNPDYFHPWQDVRFDGEYASQYRRPNGEMTMRGLRILGQEAAEVYDAVEIE